VTQGASGKVPRPTTRNRGYENETTVTGCKASCFAPDILSASGKKFTAYPQGGTQIFTHRLFEEGLSLTGVQEHLTYTAT